MPAMTGSHFFRWLRAFLTLRVDATTLEWVQKITTT
jgi:hypothetical protein